MKRYIRSSESQYKLTMQDILKKLNSLGIDTTKHKYELKADEYYGNPYVYKFTAPGNYIAYFSMTLHRKMNPKNLVEYINDYEFDFDEYPSVEAIEDKASYSWWGDGDDYIKSLKNLDTGEVLYEAEEEDEYEESEDW